MRLIQRFLVGFGLAMAFRSEARAQAREARQLIVVPAIGFGGLQRIGPQVYAGAQLQAEVTPSLFGVAQAAVWGFAAACGNVEVSPTTRCPVGGVNADVGMNLRTDPRRTTRPFIGAGVGVMTADRAAPAVNARVGVDIGRARGGMSLHLEARGQRAFGALDATAVIVSIGIAFGSR